MADIRGMACVGYTTCKGSFKIAEGNFNFSVVVVVVVIEYACLRSRKTLLAFICLVH